MPVPLGVGVVEGVGEVPATEDGDGPVFFFVQELHVHTVEL